MTEARTFQDADAAYLAWLSEFPNGWVVNVPRSGHADIVLHRSTCGMIRGARSNWTGKHYVKVVASSREALDAWASVNWSGSSRHCSHCLRPRDVVRMTPAKGAAPEQVRQHPSEMLQTEPVGEPWQLWSMGKPVSQLTSLSPQLASWDHREHPNQRKLQRYLQSVREAFGSLLAQGDKWAVSMAIDLERDERLYRGNDVENYLTPVVLALGWGRFVYAEVTKQVGGGSSISIAPAVRRPETLAWNNWSRRLKGPIVTAEGKRAIRAGLNMQVNSPLPVGPVAVHLAWRLPSNRNWVSFWKPTGDAMGPVLGEPRYARQEFHPSDDRVTSLSLHRDVDDALGRGVVDVGLWWKSYDKMQHAG